MIRDPLTHLTTDELDALLSPDAPADIVSHVATCAACATVAALDRRVVESLATLPLYQPREDLAERVMARVVIASGAAVPSPRSRSARRRAVVIGAGAGGALAAALAWAAAYPAVAVRWLAPVDTSGLGAWRAIHALLTNLSAQPWLTAVRDNLAHPARAVAVLAVAAALYGLGLTGLERLLSAPVIDASW